jgi:hypothetical protein
MERICEIGTGLSACTMMRKFLESAYLKNIFSIIPINLLSEEGVFSWQNLKMVVVAGDDW